MKMAALDRWFDWASLRVGSSRWRPFRKITSASESRRADSGVGSNVCESTPSGTIPFTVAAVPATFLAMSVIGETVVTTRSLLPEAPPTEEQAAPIMAATASAPSVRLMTRRLYSLLQYVATKSRCTTSGRYPPAVEQRNGWSRDALLYGAGAAAAVLVARFAGIPQYRE